MSSKMSFSMVDNRFIKGIELIKKTHYRASYNINLSCRFLHDFNTKSNFLKSFVDYFRLNHCWYITFILLTNNIPFLIQYLTYGSRMWHGITCRGSTALLDRLLVFYFTLRSKPFICPFTYLTLACLIRVFCVKPL